MKVIDIVIQSQIGYHFCNILFIRNKLLRSVHPQREEITQGCESQEVGIVMSLKKEQMMFYSWAISGG